MMFVTWLVAVGLALAWDCIAHEPLDGEETEPV